MSRAPGHHQGNGQKSNRNDGSSESSDLRAQAEAARALHCNVPGIRYFSEVDPFSPENTISGFICKDEGEYFGSLFITRVNGVELAKKVLIYGMPSVNNVFKANGNNRNEGARGARNDRQGDRASSSKASSSAPSSDSNVASGSESDMNVSGGQSSSPWAQLEPTSRIFIANKWNGVNLTVFKYHNQKGVQFLSVMPRGQPFVRGAYMKTLGEFLQLPLDKKLQSTIQGGSTALLKQVFPLLEQPDVQSVTYELIGRKAPQLVAYDFDLQLQPILATTYDGTIIPQALLNSQVIPVVEGQDPIQLLQENDECVISGEFGPFDFDHTLLADFARVYRSRALAINNEFRAQRGLKEGYRTENFKLEGKVVYLLNDFNGAVSRTALYKLKPADTAKSHVEVMDAGMQSQLFEALEKLYSRGIALTAEQLCREMSMSERLWDMFGANLMEMALNRPNFTLADTKKSPRMLIVMGLPGSGKSTLANKLVAAGWTRVNQDEMGNRKKVEASAKTALAKGQNVIIDRCNFDFEQRSHFLDLAHKAGTRDVRCLWLDTPAEVCKQRVSVRKNHPTIPEGDAGIQIIDRFGSLLVPPMLGEGFCQIVRASTEEEVDQALITFGTLLLQK
jgi:predicted kinase